MRCAIDQIGSQWLTAQIADVHSVTLADLHCVKTWWLSAHRMDASGSDLDVFAVADQSAKQPFGNWTAANIAGANKKNAFHDSRRACERANKVGLNANKINRRRGEEDDEAA
jgi:hypothetical protein